MKRKRKTWKYCSKENKILISMKNITLTLQSNEKEKERRDLGIIMSNTVTTLMSNEK